MVWKAYTFPVAAIAFDAEILSIVLNQIFSFDVKSLLHFW